VPKVTEGVGTSTEGFARAAENAVAAAGETVRDLRGFRAVELEGQTAPPRIAEHGATGEPCVDRETVPRS
jgi:flavin-binding protein dodecin